MAAFDDEHRRRIGLGVRRAWQKKREREGARPAHMDTWLREGRVAPELRPILGVRAKQDERMVQNLGGVDVVTAMQKAHRDGWLHAKVAADVEFACLARGEADGGPERRRVVPSGLDEQTEGAARCAACN